MDVAGLLPRRDGRSATPAATASVLLATGVVVVHLVGVRSFSHEAAPGAAPEADLPVWASLLAAGCLLLSVLAAWMTRMNRPGVALGMAAAAAGAALPVWASWTGAPTLLRSVVLTAPGLVAAGLAQVVTRWSPGRSRLGALVWMSATVVVAIHVIGYDPFADLQCARVCRSTFGPWVDLSPQTIVAVEGLLVLAIVGVGLVAAAIDRSSPQMVRASTGVSLAVVGTAVLAELVWRDTEVWARTSSSWLPWALAPSACAVCVVSARAARTRRLIDALLDDLEGGEAGGVHFAVPGEDRWIDHTGRAAETNARVAVVLHDEHGPAVRLVSMAGRHGLSGLSAARRLALANARLSALASARLADVQAAQRRAVQRADAERHRIERDLHDGAQQTLVSAAFQLGVASSRTGGSAAIDDAREQIADALSRLRDLVHGPVPGLLVDEGIRAALEDLVVDASSRARVEVHGEGEPPAEVATAAYLCAEAIVGGAAPHPCHVQVDVTDRGVRLVGRSRADLSDALGQGLLDRVGALGGAMTCRSEGLEWSTEVWLPCGS